MAGLAHLGHPAGAGAVEDEDDLVARLFELPDGLQGVDRPSQVPVGLGVAKTTTAAFATSASVSAFMDSTLGVQPSG